MSKSAPKSSWVARAEALAEIIPRSRLHPAVVAWADARPPRERWAVAFSGGGDSLALLLLLRAHWPERRSRLCALHFDHRLRGAASRGDALFCRRVSRAMGVGFAAGTWLRKPGRASEAGAREARFAFFEDEMRRRRTGVLWLGHQQDDVAETLLMRLARGSGAGGLAAPRPVQAGPGGRTHLRPLLDLKKSEIAAALRGAGAAWREDATNAGGAHFRNRVRRTVVPAWEKAANRDVLAGAARARGLLEEDDTALEAWVDGLGAVTPGGRLNLRRLAGLPRAVVRRCLHRWLLAQSRPGRLSRKGFESLLDAVIEGRRTRQSYGPDGFAVIGRTHLFFRENRLRIST